jgi:hypothetical protein
MGVARTAPGADSSYRRPVGAFFVSETTYAYLKAGLEEALADLAALADEHGSAEVATAARELSKKLAEERFNAVVVGEFKRGKTTFVNALLGAEAHPAAVIPLTSIVTAVTWGEALRAEVRFLDGRRSRRRSSRGT